MVRPGDRITYTVTIAQSGAASAKGAVVDDLSKVLDDATWVGDEKASSGTVTRSGSTLTWTGDLAVGQVVTVSYSVTVTGAGDKRIANIVTSPDKDAVCVPAADQNPDCRTTHEVDPPLSGLASTGSDVFGWLALSLGLLSAGLATVFFRRRIA